MGHKWRQRLGMAAIPFTQFLRPNGKRQVVSIVRPAPILDKAEQIMKAGFSFQIERLRNNMINMSIHGIRPSTNTEGDLATALIPNDQAVPQAVDDLVMNFVIPE